MTIAPTTEQIDPSQYTFNRAEMLARADELCVVYASARPFPHIMLDGLVPEYVIDALLIEYPEPGEAGWEQFDAQTEVKLALADITQMGPVTRNLLNELNGMVFVEFLERLTGIAGLVPDPHLDGGGLHQILPGGFLKVHADFNRHDRLRLDRRLNALFYLNRDWPQEYGGELELWNQDMTEPVEAIAPLANRLVVFSTTDFAYHGHPHPLTCPPGRARRSIATYYYSNGRPTSELSAEHSTLFKSRPGENLRRSRHETLVRWLPPVLYDRTRAWRRPET